MSSQRRGQLAGLAAAVLFGCSAPLISALRAIVALDGQQLQRAREGEEKARNRSLQLTIFFVGAVLSFSGLAAATRPRPTARLLAMVTNQRPAAAACQRSI
jgi:hypothetical protein